MSHNIPQQGNACPNDELGPELRDAVDAVMHDELPTDWASETLEGLRNQPPQHQPFQATPRKTSRRAKLIALAAVAASLVLVVQFERLGMFEDVKRLVSNVFTGPEIPEDGNPEDGQGPVDEPPKPPTEVVVPADPDTILPTLWAYQQAVRQSPEALDALLDEHADQLLPASSDSELADIWKELF